MARFFRPIILIALCLLMSCQEGGDAGDLFGQWRMKGTDDKYISFSGTLVLFRSLQEGQVYGLFEHVGDSLFIRAYSIYGSAPDTAIVEGTFGMKPFDDIRLRITTLSSDELILSKDGATWSFYQY